MHGGFCKGNQGVRRSGRVGHPTVGLVSGMLPEAGAMDMTSNGQEGQHQD